MNRRCRYALAVALFLAMVVACSQSRGETQMPTAAPRNNSARQKDAQTETVSPARAEAITLFLCGDVMTGRGIDQVMPHPVDPVIHEDYMRSASGYVHLAEEVNGPIPKPVGYSYIWGDALAVLGSIKPDLRLINLETSITTSPDFWPDKGINYRMHPANIPCLAAARIDCCVLANNHVLDWGIAGFTETMAVLSKAGLKGVGGGHNLKEAEAPAIFEIPGKGRLLVYAGCFGSSGVPDDWAATRERPGLNLLPDLSESTVARIKEKVANSKKSGDVVIFSLHWGGNWGYAIPAAQRRFAHRLIDEAEVDAVYGHSSHHVKGIEVYRGKLILYGCGDFLNDYEGITGHEEFRGDLSLMYFPSFDPLSGRLVQLRMMPMQLKRFQTIHATREDSRWLMQVLNREGQELSTRVRPSNDRSFLLEWD